MLLSCLYKVYQLVSYYEQDQTEVPDDSNPLPASCNNAPFVPLASMESSIVELPLLQGTRPFETSKVCSRRMTCFQVKRCQLTTLCA